MKRIPLIILGCFCTLMISAQNIVFATFDCGNGCAMQNESASHPGQQALIAYYNNIDKSGRIVVQPNPLTSTQSVTSPQAPTTVAQTSAPVAQQSTGAAAQPANQSAGAAIQPANQQSAATATQPVGGAATASGAAASANTPTPGSAVQESTVPRSAPVAPSNGLSNVDSNGSPFSEIIFLKAPGLNSENFANLFYSGKTFNKITFYFYNASNQLIFSQVVGPATISSIQRVAAPAGTESAPFFEKYTITYTKEVNTVFDIPTSGTTPKSLNAVNRSYGYDGATGKQVKSW